MKLKIFDDMKTHTLLSYYININVFMEEGKEGKELDQEQIERVSLGEEVQDQVGLRLNLSSGLHGKICASA